jgi:putative transposase
LKKTIRSIPIKRPRPTKKKPQGMCLDKGYDSEKHREWLRKHKYTPHVRSRGEEKKKLKKKKGKARRWVVERTHSWFNRNRALLIRWEKDPKNYKAMMHIAAGLICFRSFG